MATSKTPRVGLMRWTDNSDPYPTRAEWDAEQTVLEARVLVWRGQGTLENRPPAGVPGGVYVVPSADSVVTYYDTGSKWIESSQLGGIVPSPVNVGGTGTEGSSVRAARADHTHTIAPATSSNAGAMSATDKAKLDASTSSAGANTLAQRNSSGGTAFSSVSLSNAPSAAGDATRKDYVDSTANSAASSAVNAIPLATSTVDGLMRKSDKSALDGATNSGTPNALVKRDSAGRSAFNSVGINNAPTGASDATRKDYVDGLVSAVRDVVDAGTASATANTLARRDANGDSSFRRITLDGDPTSSAHAARKAYVDAQDAFRLPTGIDIAGGSINDLRADGIYYQLASTPITPENGYPINGAAGTLIVTRFSGNSSAVIQQWTEWNSRRVWVRSTNVTSGWANGWRELAGTEVATSSSDGLMSASDKKLLDTSTANVTASAIVRRWSSGHISVPSVPDTDNMATSKSYVDSTSQSAATSAANAAVAAIPNATASVDGLMSKADKSKLDKATSAATASTLVMLDSAGRARVKNPSATEDIANKAYTDSTAASAASSAVSAIPNATSSVDGLMPKADKAKLDAATQNATNNTLVQRSSAGGIVVSGVKLGDTTPSGNDYATSKSYVDAQDAKQVTAATALNTSDLNTVSTDGNYVQTSNANATAARNYPTGGEYAGLLVVSSYSSFIFQTYTLYNGSASNAGRTFIRTKYGSSWSSWIENATVALATASADGLMSKADKALLDTATWAADANALVKRVSTGQIRVPDAPVGDWDATSKGYVDSLSPFVKGPSVGSGTDLNTLTTPGDYTISAYANAVNVPPGFGQSTYMSFFARLTVRVLGSAGAVIQTMEYDNNVVWTRSYRSSSWSPWVESLTSYSFQAGRAYVKPTAANTPTSVRVNFANRYPSGTEIAVNATLETSVPGTTVTGISVSSISNTGFDLYITRTNTTGTYAQWMAMPINQ